MLKSKLVTALFFLFVFGVEAQSLRIISNGKVGIGTSNPDQKLEVTGAITLNNSDSETPKAGTIRWNGADFEGYTGSEWKSLTMCPCDGENPPTPPSCNDGIKNQNETGVDCGGVCPPCDPGGCHSVNNFSVVRDLPNNGFNNQVNVGGTSFNGDGSLSFKLTSISGNSQQVIGMDANPSQNAQHNSIDFGILFYLRTDVNRHWMRIIENGAYKSGWITSISSITNKEIVIERDGNQVRYKVSGSTIHTSTTSNSSPMFFDNSFAQSSAGAWGVRPCVINVGDISLCSSDSASSTESSSESRTSVPSDIQISAISPNPLHGLGQFSYSIPNGQGKVLVYNNLGQIVKSYTSLTKSGVLTLDSSSMDKGVYHYSLFVNEKLVKSHKLVVE